MNLTNLQMLYKALETECKTIEALISSRERRHNPAVTKKLDRLKAAIQTLQKLVLSKRQSHSRH